MILPLYKRFSFGNACIAAAAAVAAAPASIWRVFPRPESTVGDQWTLSELPTPLPAGVAHFLAFTQVGVTLNSVDSEIPVAVFEGWAAVAEFLSLVDKSLDMALEKDQSLYLRAILSRDVAGYPGRLCQTDWYSSGLIFADELHLCIHPDARAFFHDDAVVAPLIEKAIRGEIPGVTYIGEGIGELPGRIQAERDDAIAQEAFDRDPGD